MYIIYVHQVLTAVYFKFLKLSTTCISNQLIHKVMTKSWQRADASAAQAPFGRFWRRASSQLGDRTVTRVALKAVLMARSCSKESNVFHNNKLCHSMIHLSQGSDSGPSLSTSTTPWWESNGSHLQLSEPKHSVLICWPDWAPQFPLLSTCSIL